MGGKGKRGGEGARERAIKGVRFSEVMRQGTYLNVRNGRRLVVIGRAFFLFFPCNHIINIKKKSFSGEAKDSVIFPFYFLLHKSG